MCNEVFFTHLFSKPSYFLAVLNSENLPSSHKQNLFKQGLRCPVLPSFWNLFSSEWWCSREKWLGDRQHFVGQKFNAIIVIYSSFNYYIISLLVFIDKLIFYECFFLLCAYAIRSPVNFSHSKTLLILYILIFRFFEEFALSRRVFKHILWLNSLILTRGKLKRFL